LRPLPTYQEMDGQANGKQKKSFGLAHREALSLAGRSEISVPQSAAGSPPMISL